MITLVALGVGFVVLYLADKSSSGIKRLGQIIGGVILALSMIVLVLQIYFSLVAIRMMKSRRVMPQRQGEAAPAQPLPRTK